MRTQTCFPGCFHKGDSSNGGRLGGAWQRQHKDGGVFVPEGPDYGSDSTELVEVRAWNAWNVPSRSPSRRVRYDRLVRGAIVSHGGQGVVPQITPFPTGRIMAGLYQAFHAGLPSFRPSGTNVSFLTLTRMGSRWTRLK
jgi:hypothetical protein